MQSTQDIVRTIRLSQKLSVNQLATKLGCSRQTIYNWEDGITEPKLSQFLHLCMMTGFNSNNLLTKTIFKKDKEKDYADPGKYSNICKHTDDK
ncbi:helix-turn-helix transcriptional regulator [Shewanella sp. VB17]|uniref:helix-turn-helix domain-containing protein n=1 Tax=Shewanella sp. VB17 TaxID=2739432 RepID=UPI001565678B|nr:helix-turn-helix transcriptional regulator [Shewanella sp. VB17]